MTVRGAISPDGLGITLSHEHLIVDGTCWFAKPTEASKTYLVDAPITIEILGELRRNPSISKENLRLCDVNTAIAELMKFKMMGGKSIVDLTLPGIGRDPVALRGISEVTGVNIICGTGWYVDASHPAYVKTKSIDELTAIMVQELTECINGTEIKAGVMGELGCSVPLTQNEKKVLQAAGRAQAETGASITIHPGQFDTKKKQLNKKANEYIDLIQKEGANLKKVYMSHMSTVCSDLEYQKMIIDKYGVTLSWDTFGQENYMDDLWIGMPRCVSDMERVTALMKLLNSGYEKNFMLSHDICRKHCLTKYGGYGYAHILEHIVPMLKSAGATNKQIKTMLVDNPKRILSY